MAIQKIAVGRLRRAVRELLAAARRGDCEPTAIELFALAEVCVEHGELDSARAIARYASATFGHDVQQRGTTNVSRVN